MTGKTHRSRGFTLAETLIAIVILALVTAAGAVATTAILATRNRMIELANAQTLGSTAAELLADELRFGQNIVVPAAANSPAASIDMDSTLFGNGCTIKADGGRLVASVKPAAAGGTAKTFDAFAASLYRELQFNKLTFTLLPVGTEVAGATLTAPAVQVDMAIANSNGLELWTTRFAVLPLNSAAANAGGG